MNYRRVFQPGGTYFFTVVTFERRPIFKDQNAVDAFNRAVVYTQMRMPFSIVAYVILRNHLHFIWTLPPESSNYSTRWRLLKSHFTRSWSKDEPSVNLSLIHKGEKDVWQRRFWEHFIKDEADFQNHIEYIHYNPVKHGLVMAPNEWKNSSFQMYVADGFYAMDWGSSYNEPQMGNFGE